jgi:HK97 family phage portal protein
MVQIHYATDGRDMVVNTPDGWEIDQPWLWWDGPANSDGTGGPWGNPPPGAELAAPGLRGTSVPAVSRCLQLTADKTASMPWKTYRGRESVDPPSWILDPQATARDGRRPITSDDAVRLSGVDFWAQHIRSMLLWGEGITYTPRVRDAFGQPTGPIVAPLYNLHPKYVHLDARGWYVEDADGDPDYLDPRELIITRWIMQPGRQRGVGVIKAHAIDLGFAANVRAYADNLMRRGVPGGYLKSTKPDLNQQGADTLKSAWMNSHDGVRKSIAVLNATTEFHPIELDPESAQYIDMARLSSWQIALMFGVPPSRLGINMGQPNTYANLESDNAVYVQDALLTIARKIEAAIDAVLPVGTELKIDFNMLLRADTSTRFAAYETGIRAGFLTVDEVRAWEDLPPLPAPPAAAAPANVVPLGAAAGDDTPDAPAAVEGAA